MPLFYIKDRVASTNWTQVPKATISEKRASKIV